MHLHLDQGNEDGMWLPLIWTVEGFSSKKWIGITWTNGLETYDEICERHTRYWGAGLEKFFNIWRVRPVYLWRMLSKWPYITVTSLERHDISNQKHQISVFLALCEETTVVPVLNKDDQCWNRFLGIVSSYMTRQTVNDGFSTLLQWKCSPSMN